MEIDKSVLLKMFDKAPNEIEKNIFMVDEDYLQERLLGLGYTAVKVTNEADAESIAEVIKTAVMSKQHTRDYAFLVLKVAKTNIEVLQKSLNNYGIKFDRGAYKILHKQPSPVSIEDSKLIQLIDRYTGVNREASPKKIINALELQNKEIPPLIWYVEGLIPGGETIISAESKLGKSWFSLDMGISISLGHDFLGRKTNKAGVLYLALEDSERRLQKRMRKLLKGQPAPANLYFQTLAETLDNGLIDSLEMRIKEHSDIKVIIIDTFQKIRGSNNTKNAYANDYADMGELKKFADRHDMAVILIHHNRKMRDDDDPFNMLSGTNGIMGAADTIITFTRKKRQDTEIKMHITGRDVISQDYEMEFSKDTCKWKQIGEVEAIEVFREQDEYNNNPVVKAIKILLKGNVEGWTGTATEMQEAVMKYGDECIPSNSIGKRLRDLKVRLFDYDRIIYTVPTNTKNKLHKIKYAPVIDILTDTTDTADTADTTDTADTADTTDTH